MSLVYYIVLGVTAVSYLLGLFLSYWEKKSKVSILSNVGDAGFINVFSNDYLEKMEIEKPMMHQQGLQEEQQVFNSSSYMDEEIL